MKGQDKAKPRILAVDDEPDFLELVRFALAGAYDLHCLSSGEDILDHVAAIEPDLAILDVYMPGADGFQLGQQIRSDGRFSSLPLLFLTSSKKDEDFFKALELGAASYLNKPIRAGQLRSRIREILGT